MGGYPPYGTVTGGFPSRGVAATDGVSSNAEVGWKLGVQLGRGGKIGFVF